MAARYEVKTQYVPNRKDPDDPHKTRKVFAVVGVGPRGVRSQVATYRNQTVALAVSQHLNAYRGMEENA